MPNLDQQTYYDLIQEAMTLRDHLKEWREQFRYTLPESLAVSDAHFATIDVVSGLVQARSQNAMNHQQKIDEALARVANGTSTVHDASLLRSAVK